MKSFERFAEGADALGLRVDLLVDLRGRVRDGTCLPGGGPKTEGEGPVTEAFESESGDLQKGKEFRREIRRNERLGRPNNELISVRKPRRGGFTGGFPGNRKHRRICVSNRGEPTLNEVFLRRTNSFRRRIPTYAKMNRRRNTVGRVRHPIRIERKSVIGNHSVGFENIRGRESFKS